MTNTIRFKNGSIIHTTPGRRDKLRGFTTAIIEIDSCATLSDAEWVKLYKLLVPKGKMILISTPRKTTN